MLEAGQLITQRQHEQSLMKETWDMMREKYGELKNVVWIMAEGRA